MQIVAKNTTMIQAVDLIEHIDFNPT